MSSFVSSQQSDVYCPVDQSVNLSWLMVGALTLLIIGLATILFVYNFFYSAHFDGSNNQSRHDYPYDFAPSAVPGQCMSWPVQADDCTCFVKGGRDCRNVSNQPSNQSTGLWPATHCSAPADRKGQFVARISNGQTAVRSYTVLPMTRLGNGMPAAHKPRSILIWCPDLHSHCGHSMYLAQHLALHGHALMGIDYPGFGESREPFVGCSTQPGAIDDWHELVESVEQFMIEVASRFPSTPLFIAGEGIGAVVALYVAARHSINRSSVNLVAMVLLSPALKLQTTWRQRNWISFCAHLMPSRKVPSLWPIHLISRNRAANEHFVDDPLCLTGSITAHTAYQLQQMIDALHPASKDSEISLSSINLPFIVQHGVRDRACAISGTRMLVDATTGVPDHQKRFLAHKFAWHSLLHEAEWERTCECIVEYCDDRLQHLSQSRMLD